MPTYEIKAVKACDLKAKGHGETFFFLQNSGSENLCPQIKALKVWEKILERKQICQTKKIKLINEKNDYFLINNN